MNKDFKDILAGEGLGQLRFGMSRREVSDILGEPDEIDTFPPTEEEDELTEAWHYDSLELSASFDEQEDWRLVNLSVSAPHYQFEGRSLIGLSREELLDFLNELELNELIFEDWPSDDSPDHKLIASEEAGINFWLDEGVVSEIQWGPLYSEEDECFEWPE
ncbi:hypothetical protein [Nafulsella turpanensis]|uniref:hypothetical protein n=1 Tax=Nafulsella turpanensis TaxID=1265690 RepID=UPI00034C043D|nr:hypothetical protein [Nafulsella turpanensis]